MVFTKNIIYIDKDYIDYWTKSRNEIKMITNNYYTFSIYQNVNRNIIAVCTIYILIAATELSINFQLSSYSDIFFYKSTCSWSIMRKMSLPLFVLSLQLINYIARSQQENTYSRAACMIINNSMGKRASSTGRTS